MRCVVLLVALCALPALTGCSSSEEGPTRGSDGIGRTGPPRAPAREERGREELPEVEKIETPEVVQPEAEEPERDLGEELKQAVGDLTPCLSDYEATTATTIQISISAIVRPTGMVIQPSVNGPGISLKARDCIATRVSNVVLRPLDSETSEEATVSERVATNIGVDFEPGVVVSDEPPSRPKPDDVVLPMPKLPTIKPSGIPIDAVKGDPIDGPAGVPIDGPAGVPIEGPKGIPIQQEDNPDY